jgi:NAD(P)-dependent dehydrogenase (short-subunit alcohol dehydrogenase family)
MNRLDGKVALVSGAARGIGAETAHKKAVAGASVMIGDVLVDRARETAKEITDTEGLTHQLIYLEKYAAMITCPSAFIRGTRSAEMTPEAAKYVAKFWTKTEVGIYSAEARPSSAHTVSR